MERIISFTVDHDKLQRGLYVGRKDGDITTFDLRMRRPYLDEVLTGIEMHSLEHLLAYALRNGKNKEKVLYVGPMGCATGFYVLYQGIGKAAAVKDLTEGFKQVLAMDVMPGDSRAECGDCRTLDLAAGKKIAAEYLETIEDKTKPDEYL